MGSARRSRADASSALDRAATVVARIHRGEAGSRGVCLQVAPGRAAPFKLYVSPTTDTLPDAVRAVATALADAPGVLGFKVGRTVDGVARPDKMVAYFASLDELHGGADRVRDEAAGCRPHGVPFTAGVTDDGLLSWAMDPPRGPAGTSHHATPASWRTWVSMRLADYLLDARARDAQGAGGEPWQVALARLQLDGVDTASWVPGPRSSATGRQADRP